MTPKEFKETFSCLRPVRAHDIDQKLTIVALRTTNGNKAEAAKLLASTLAIDLKEAKQRLRELGHQV